MITKRQKIYIGIGLTFAVLIAIVMKKSAAKFSKIVQGTQAIRGLDSKGSGAFGANRGTRKHQGIDIVTKTNDIILSPINGIVTRYAKPYADDNRYSGIEIKNAFYSVKMFYLSPTVAVNTLVKAGEPIGKAQDLNEKFGAEMTNHVHIEVRTITGNLLDPTNLI